MHLTFDAAGWDRGARIVVSFAYVFEGAGQANSGAGGMIPDPIERLVADLPTNAFFAYGRYEGVPCVLDLMDRHGAKLSSLIIGSAVETSPDLAAEIVRRSHEPDAHGQGCENSFQLSIDKEMRFIADSVETIRRVTGQKAIGWNAHWMRSSIHLLETLQQLGFLSQVDGTGREPLSVRACGSDFINVPYACKVNDVLSFPFEGWNATAYQQALRDEFDQLSEEGANRRRMIVLRLRDRISVTGLPSFRA
jgi:peptidoglycan/xylan/chitin deacetylase (PgdA/CDA1 family)